MCGTMGKRGEGWPIRNISCTTESVASDLGLVTHSIF